MSASLCTFIYCRTLDGVLVGMNRDERPDRRHVAYREEDGLFYPVDPESGGTWFGTSSEGHIAALLNGRDARDGAALSGAVSRGTVVPFQLGSREHVFPDLEGMAAFQSFFYDPFSDGASLRRWDGETLSAAEAAADLLVLVSSGYGAADERERFVRGRLERRAPVSPEEMMDLLSLKAPTRDSEHPLESAIAMTGAFSRTVASCVVEFRLGELSFWSLSGAPDGAASYELVTPQEAT